MVMKGMLNDWERHHPGRCDVMFRALQKVRSRHLADDKLWDFSKLERDARSSSD